jgi:hypothetical protein
MSYTAGIRTHDHLNTKQDGNHITLMPAVGLTGILFSELPSCSAQVH